MSSGTLHIVDSRTQTKYQIPIKRNAVSALDLKKIRGLKDGADRADHVSNGLRVYDPGLQNTAIVETAISFSDHDQGLLLFRGYSLEQLWNSDFEDMLHLLVWGTYPTRAACEGLRRELALHMRSVPSTVQRTVEEFPKTAPPLALILAGLAACLACMPETIPASTDANLYQGNPENVDRAIIRTVAQYAVVFGLVNSHRKGVPFTPPSADKNYCENLFAMAGMIDPSTCRPSPIHVSCFRRFAMLNADHGMALTVFSSLATASSLTDPLSCLMTAVTSAYGPLHFGATESAQRALREIKTPDRIPAFIEEVKQGKRKLFGYGHRSYRGLDPRVRPIQSILQDLDPSSNPLLEIVERIERMASQDEYFLTRGLYPNADLYGNFVFTGIGFEPEIIPAAMLAQRIMGVMAHWREYMLTRGKLFRPLHLYTGNTGEKTSIMPQSPTTETTPLLPPSKPPYSTFTTTQKRLIILTAALASTFSPFSANIYYPALNSIAADLHVTISQVNLTITTYMICQALAPTLTGSLADQTGRRPAYLLCFLIYIAGNVALALQNSYIALLILRAVQSCGSSGTVALASAVAADVITSAERGTYMGIASLGNILAPSLGPILGGLLSQRISLPNPLATLRLLTHLPTGFLLLANGLIFASYYAVTAGLPAQLKDIYALDDMAIGLSFIPAGLGSLASAAINGFIVDWKYRRAKARTDITRFSTTTKSTRNHHRSKISNKTKTRSLSNPQGEFDIEKVRLSIGAPMTIFAATAILAYAFLLPLHPPLPIILLLLFIISFFITAAYNIMNILLVDLYYSTPATAMAANNLVRCFLGAAATAFVHPLILRWGHHITYTTVAGLIFAAVGPLLSVTLPLLPLPSEAITLKFRYPSTQWVTPGDTLLMSKTHPLPIISTYGLDPETKYLLLFVDLDVIYGSLSTVVLHWYQPGMEASPIAKPGPDRYRAPRIVLQPPSPPPHHRGVLVNTTSGAEYIAPQPPQGQNHHRYVYLLFRQPTTYTFPECFAHIFPPALDARVGFDVRQFVRVAGLDAPVAASYFFVERDEPVFGTPTVTATGTTAATATGTRSPPRTSPTTTWLRPAPCETTTSARSLGRMSEERLGPVVGCHVARTM
ncbi:citrate synthase [Aspergillus taichungensis]|uniref:Citrate synthase n=1 Tax=Aspergillus taichungensis TaxID=482145 RepID=A0A2J5I0D6_9EURO|nr:citrate synthase [Aspergillus taichungensis]